MLKTANVQLKVMNQILDRLIPSDDSHTVIAEGETYSIEVIPENLMTFRVPSKDAPSPARLSVRFNYANEAEGSTGQGDFGAAANGSSQVKKRSIAAAGKDLRIYVSQDEKEPREGRCDATYLSEGTFFVYANNKQAKIFETNNIYVSFYSLKGCSINVTVKFTDP